MKNYYDIYWLTTSNYDFKFLKSNNISEKNIFFFNNKIKFSDVFEIPFKYKDVIEIDRNNLDVKTIEKYFYFLNNIFINKNIDFFVFSEITHFHEIIGHRLSTYNKKSLLSLVLLEYHLIKFVFLKMSIKQLFIN